MTVSENVCALDVLKMFWQRSSSVLRVIALLFIITTIIILSWTKVREVKTDTSDPRATVSPPLTRPPRRVTPGCFTRAARRGTHTLGQRLNTL